MRIAYYAAQHTTHPAYTAMQETKDPGRFDMPV
jgi:hypothetical protein